MPAALTEMLRDQPLSPEKVRFAWRVAVGETLDRVTRVSLLPGGTLEVLVEDGRWRKEIERSAPLIRTRMKGTLGPDIVRSIVLSGLHAARRQRPSKLSPPHGVSRDA